MAALSRFISRLSEKSHAFFETLKNPREFLWTEKCEAAIHKLKHAVSAVLVREEGNKQLPISGRLAKWAVELGEYDVIFRPATAIKSQILADFVAEFSPNMLLELEQENLLQDKATAEGVWVLYVDGSSNVGGAGVGIVLTSHTGNTASRAVRCNFKATNNESEYKSLIARLTLAQQMGAENIQVHSDSELIIN
ncbi:hypothetical protein Bca4012_063461 [Brassica carinata]